MVHSRVAHGSTAQLLATSYLISLYTSCRIVSAAPAGSNIPDIIATIDNIQFQCEVKGSFNFTSPVVTINKTVKRGCKNIVDDLVPVMTNGLWDSVEESVDFHRLTDETIGFPNDVGAPNSGKLPKCLKIDDPSILHNIRQEVLANFRRHRDAYFILVCKRPTVVPYIFYTGYGENVLNAQELPQLSMAKLRTYGTARKDSMRVALKVRFVLPT